MEVFFKAPPQSNPITTLLGRTWMDLFVQDWGFSGVYCRAGNEDEKWTPLQRLCKLANSTKIRLCPFPRENTSRSCESVYLCVCVYCVCGKDVNVVIIYHTVFKLPLVHEICVGFHLHRR